MNLQEKCVKESEKYDFVAPDGGWGYLVIGAAVVIFLIVSGFVPCFGLMYQDPIAEIGLGSTDISLINAVLAISFACTGFLTNCLLQHFTPRVLAFFAITLFNCGNVIAIFIKSVTPFFVIQILQGAGFGLLINLTFGRINEYFVERRLFASSVMQTFQAALAMLVPQFITLLRETYGYKGAMIMITGVSLQGYVAVAVLQPVKWHMKKVPKIAETEESKVFLEDDDDVPTVKLNDLQCHEECIMETVSEKKYSSWIVKKLNKMFDVSVIKYLLRSSVSYGVSVSPLTDGMFIILLPQALYSYGWDEKPVALAMTLYMFGDVAGRIFFMVLSNWVNVGNQEMYLTGILLMVLGRTGFLCTSNHLWALICITTLGVARSFIVLFFPLIVAESVSMEKFSAAMGFSMLMIGSCSFILSPVIGAIRDYTQSYDITFWFLSTMNLICLISWTVELIYKKRKLHMKFAKT